MEIEALLDQARQSVESKEPLRDVSRAQESFQAQDPSEISDCSPPSAVQSRRERRRRRRATAQSSWTESWTDPVMRHAQRAQRTISDSDWVDPLARQARRVQRQVSHRLRTDDQGVRTVDFEYVQRDPKAKFVKPRRRRPQRSPLFQLPPSFEEPDPPAAGPKERTIYNPYNRQQQQRDLLDKVGDYVADAADQFMWGQYDREPSQSTTSGPIPERPPRQADPRGPPKAYKHWRDRLEERFDSMLGIHEDGDYYNSWMEREANEEVGDGDAFSVAQGKRPPRKRHRGVDGLYKKPFWEEEGSLLGVLLGRRTSGEHLRFDELIDKQSGSLVNLLRSAIKSSLLVASYVCRWASVRGALPQPVVVLGVVSAVLSSRRGGRIRAVIVALLLMRTLGELVHGYLYDDEDWEDYVVEERGA